LQTITSSPESGWKSVKELTEEDKLVLQKSGSFGKVHIDQEMALMLGWLTGDGLMTKDVQECDILFWKC